MKKILIFLCSILIFSCQEQVVELEIPGHTPFLVVNGILDTDSIMSLHVSNSVGAFQQGEINSISDANVLLYEDNNLLGEMSIDFNNQDSIYILEQSGYWWGADQIEPIYYYTFDALPMVGSTYSIEVEHSNFESVTAETTVPEEIDLTELEIIDNSDLSDVYVSTLNLSFFDDPNVNNYYRISLYVHTSGEVEDEDGEFESEKKSYPLILYSNDPSFSQGIPWDGYSFSGRRVFFSDDLFNGTQKEISFDFEYKIDAEMNDSIFLQLTSFSEEAFNYYNSMEVNDDSFFSDFGTEPVPVFTNVENGAGVFASGKSIYFQVIP
tara:strand:- start:134 stop:1102 length:969 start_codon:yes stop_codon:yes gene_type:complete